MDKPKLEKVSFYYTQNGNTLGTTEEIEYLTIDVENLYLNERDGDCFYVIKTNGWSINGIEELKELFDNVKKAVIEADK